MNAQSKTNAAKKPAAKKPATKTVNWQAIAKKQRAEINELILDIDEQIRINTELATQLYRECNRSWFSRLFNLKG